MAIIQTSGLITHIKGSIAGTTFQRGQAGLIARKKPIPIGNNSNAQSAQRVIVSTLNREWNNLTDAQRKQWQAFANYTNGIGKTNRNNLSGQTGKTQFTAVNAWLLLYNKPLLITPSFLPPLAPISPYYNINNESDNLGKTVGSLNTATSILVTQVSLSVSNSTYKSNRGYRSLVYTQASGTTQNWSAEYEAYFGVPLVIGRKYFIQLKVVNFVTGQMSGFSTALIRLVAPTPTGIGTMAIGSTFIVA